MNLTTRMSVVAAHSLFVNTESKQATPITRRARARELCIITFLLGLIFVVIHLATNILGIDLWLCIGVALFGVSAVALFRGDAIYDRAVNTTGDELAVRRLLQG